MAAGVNEERARPMGTGTQRGEDGADACSSRRRPADHHVSLSSEARLSGRRRWRVDGGWFLAACVCASVLLVDAQDVPHIQGSWRVIYKVRETIKTRRRVR